MHIGLDAEDKHGKRCMMTKTLPVLLVSTSILMSHTCGQSLRQMALSVIAFMKLGLTALYSVVEYEPCLIELPRQYLCYRMSLPNFW